MKVVIVLAVSLAVFGASFADEEKKDKILKYYKCLACNEDQAAREEYMKCAEMKPEKCKITAQECKDKYMPGTTPEDRWNMICQNEGGLAEKLYDCIVNSESKKDLNDDEKTQLKEFVTCAKKVNKKFCDH